MTELKPNAKVALSPVQPFNFPLSSAIYTRFEAYTHTAYFDDIFYKCIKVDEDPFLLTIKEENGNLIAQSYGADISDDLEKIANWVISSNLDLNPFYSNQDSVMKHLINRLYGLKPPRTASIFEALVIAYTEQQISLNVAMVFQKRIVEHYGAKIKHDMLTFYSFPTPKVLASADVNELRSLGLSRNKANFITEMSKKVVSGELDLESLKTKPTAEVRMTLQSIRGVGDWTSDYVLVRGLGRIEMVPYDDLGTQDSIGLYYKGGERATREEVKEILSRFGFYAGLANYYLIYARFFGVEPLSRPTSSQRLPEV
jgi:DNA-3-methyladenine glycosylase II